MAAKVNISLAPVTIFLRMENREVCPEVGKQRSAVEEWKRQGLLLGIQHSSCTHNQQRQNIQRIWKDLVHRKKKTNNPNQT